RPIAYVQGEQNLGVDTVAVLLAQPLRGGTAAGSVVEIQHRRIEVLRGAAAVEARAAIDERPAFDQQSVAPVGKLDAPRRAPAVLLRHSVGPLLGRRFKVAVSRHVAV